MTTTERDYAREIDDLLADDISSTKAEEIYPQLVDARQRVLAVIRDCVLHDDAGRLAALCTGRHAVHRVLDDNAVPLTVVRERVGQPFDSAEVAVVHAVRALAALGLALVSGPEQAAFHFEVFRRWVVRSGLDVPDQPVRRIPRSIDTPHVSVMRSLAESGELDLLSLVWMTQLDGRMDHGSAHVARPGPSTEVLLDRGREGQDAILSVAWIPGMSGGLVPDPATMALSSADERFRSSLAAAWDVAGRSPRGALLWSLRGKDGPVLRVTNESMSAAFAVLIDEWHRVNRPMLGRLTLRRLRSRVSIVGRIDPDSPEAMSSVSGYDAKLSVVDENTRVILPEEDLRVAVQANRGHADLVPVRTWRQAARAARAFSVRRMLAFIAPPALTLVLILGALFSVSQARRSADAQAAVADSAADALLDRATDDPWQRLDLDTRAYRTSDRLDTRERLRAWARQLRFAEALITPERGSDAPVVNSDGSAVAIPGVASGDVPVWDFAVSPPQRFVATADGAGPTVVTWVGRDVVAASRRQGKTALWNVRTRSLVRLLDGGGDVVVADPTGRWLGYGLAGTSDFQVVDLANNTTDVLRLPGELQRGGPRQALLSPLVMVQGVLATGELVVSDRAGVSALSRAGTRRLDARAHVAHVVDLGYGQAVVEGCVGGRHEVFGLATSTVLASRVVPSGMAIEPHRSCEESSVAFSPGSGQVVAVAVEWAPKGSPPTAYVALGPDPGTARRIEIPSGHRLVRATVDGSRTYQLVLDSGSELLVLRVPPPDAMEVALIHAQYAVVSPDGRHLVLKYPDDHVESWDFTTRGLVGTAPPGSAEFNQAGAGASLVLSPDGSVLVTVHHDSSAKLWRLPDLQPLGDVPLSAASPAFMAENDPEEFSATVSFVDVRRILVTYGDGFSLWGVTPLAKHTEARISLPEADGPTDWQVVLPDRAELLTVRGSRVQRNRLADGALVQGSVFSLGDVDSRDVQLFQPAIDDSETLMAVFNADGIEIWNLLRGSRVDRLHLADDTEAIDVRFGEDTDEVDFLLGHFRTEKAAGIYPQRWHRNAGFGLLKWLGLDKTGVEMAPDKMLPAIFAWPGADGGFEPTDPRAWLDRICQISPALGEEEPLGTPDGAWRGLICAHR